MGRRTSSQHALLLLLSLLPIPAAAAATSRTTNSTAPVAIKTTRIIGGFEAVSGQFPWYVHAITDELCGGTLIAPDIVMTAAHCHDAYTGSVYIGGVLIDGQDLLPSQVIAVQSILQHPTYSPGPEDNDIMLVQLSTTTNTPYVTVNADPALPWTGQSVTTMGFGQTSEGGVVSNTLLQVTVDAIDIGTCQQELPGINDFFHICAGVPKGGKDSCGGDSGG
jgi:trypsin